MIYRIFKMKLDKIFILTTLCAILVNFVHSDFLSKNTENFNYLEGKFFNNLVDKLIDDKSMSFENRVTLKG